MLPNNNMTDVNERKGKRMNKTFLTVLLVFGLFVIGCGNQQNQAASGGQQATLPSMTSEVKSVAQQATQKAGQTQQNLQQTAGEMAKKAQTLLAQAKQYLDQGKFNEAISVAQNILSFDPKNMDAQKIIETAKTKLQALATQKAQDLKSGLMNQLGTVGQ